MIGIVWTYTVSPDHIAVFERCYSADGDWAQLFRCAPGFRFTSLARDAENPDRYLTIDAWDDLESFERFKQEFAREYAALDKECDGLTIEERKVGVFEVLS